MKANIKDIRRETVQRDFWIRAQTDIVYTWTEIIIAAQYGTTGPGYAENIIVMTTRCYR